VVISYNTHPRDQTSLLESYGLSFHTSGLKLLLKDYMEITLHNKEFLFTCKEGPS